MNNDYNKQLMEDSPLEYAYNRIKYNEEGIPKVYVYSPEPNYFKTHFINISRGKVQINKLKSLDEERKNRAAEVVVANKELAFQNEEKEKLAAELFVANTDLEEEISERKKAEEEIKKLNYELEWKISERTYHLEEINSELERTNAMLEDEIELSYHDPLTGLYNRRFYEEELTRLDTKRNRPLTIVMGDVNALKLTNDSFGHTTGDRLLKKVAEVIRKGCRVDDIIARLGGDEFVIILPQTGAYEAEQMIKRFKDIASNEKIDLVDISVSYGYETKINEDIEVQEVLKKAEEYMYKEKLFEGPKMREKTISAIITTLYKRNKREEDHSYRVSALCENMGKVIGLPEEEIEELKTTGLLHDIGKIAIDENILNKTGNLTEDEWKEIMRHPEIGYRILNTVNDMSNIAYYLLHHHEKWDGSGYPKGLKGDEIPFVSRIINIVEAFEVITSENSYRKAQQGKYAIEELEKNAGIQFDPKLVSVFIEKVLGQASKEDNF